MHHKNGKKHLRSCNKVYSVKKSQGSDAKLSYQVVSTFILTINFGNYNNWKLLNNIGLRSMAKGKMQYVQSHANAVNTVKLF